jgi:hypothetical protein
VLINEQYHSTLKPARTQSFGDHENGFFDECVPRHQPKKSGFMRGNPSKTGQFFAAMCGRYPLSRRKQIIEEHFDAISGEEDWTPRYNVAPTQPVLVIRQNPADPTRNLSQMRWGLIPSWWRQKAINICHGVAPGSEQWKHPEATLGYSPMQRVVKVTTPTLIAYLPDAAKVRQLLL